MTASANCALPCSGGGETYTRSSKTKHLATGMRGWQRSWYETGATVILSAECGLIHIATTTVSVENQQKSIDQYCSRHRKYLVWNSITRIIQTQSKTLPNSLHLKVPGWVAISGRLLHPSTMYNFFSLVRFNILIFVWWRSIYSSSFRLSGSMVRMSHMEMSNTRKLGKYAVLSFTTEEPRTFKYLQCCKLRSSMLA